MAEWGTRLCARLLIPSDFLLFVPCVAALAVIEQLSDGMLTAAGFLLLCCFRWWLCWHDWILVPRTAGFVMIHPAC